jgi:hypothetical protein
MTTLYGHEAKEVLTSNDVDFEDIAEGEQVKYNHATCHMGEDTKQRLYIKNVDGAYLWHCHNCGDSGYYRPREFVSRMKAVSTGPVKLSGTVKLPPAREVSYDKFDVRAQLWLGSYEFESAACSNYRISTVVSGVVLPIWNAYTPVGWQVRKYEGNPKYVTYTNQTHSYLSTTALKGPLIIVEDLLSSYKLHMAGYDTLCLLGTKIDDTGLTIVKNYDRVVVWLDEDEAGHTASLKIYKEISPLVKDITSINMQQPKEIPYLSLKDMEL